MHVQLPGMHREAPLDARSMEGNVVVACLYETDDQYSGVVAEL